MKLYKAQKAIARMMVTGKCPDRTVNKAVRAVNKSVEIESNERMLVYHLDSKPLQNHDENQTK